MSSDSKYLQKQKKFWDADEKTSRFDLVDSVSRTEDEYNRRADRDFEILFSGVRITPNWTILEIGCGVGRLLSRLLSRTNPGKVIGVDISEGMIQHARNALGTRDNLTLAVNSGTDLSMIPDRSVDFAYSYAVFIHIHDIAVVQRYLSEVQRVLRPSGFFKFNVRRMDLVKMFSNSPGGLVAKVSYVIGARSPIKEASGQTIAGFSGIHYRERDLRHLVKVAGMEITDAVHMEEQAGPVNEGRILCTCRPRG
jgi:ubiquinone/menaquinone biosynthesis C-methylase UbiE